MPEYLMHFNRNHDKKGRFDFGDGDGDGIANDHAHRSLSERYGAAVDRHRSRVMETETYRTNRDSLRLKQAQMANQKHSAQTDIKARNLDMKTQRSLNKAQNAKIKNQMAEEQARRQIEKEREKAQLSNERAATAEAKAKEAAAREQLKQQQREERSQQKMERLQLKAEKAQQKMERDRQKAERQQYQAMIAEQKKYKREVAKQEARLKAEYRKMNRREGQKSRMRTAAIVTAVAGMPLTSLGLLAGSVGSKNRGFATISSALTNPVASMAIVGKGIKEDINTLRRFN